jgi:hypothetical protein
MIPDSLAFRLALTFVLSLRERKAAAADVPATDCHDYAVPNKDSFSLGEKTRMRVTENAVHALGANKLRIAL